MDINFPANPGTGHLWIHAARTWMFNGQGWQLQSTAGAGGGTLVFVAGIIPQIIPFAQHNFVKA